MKRSEARQAAGRVMEIKDATPDTIARYCQPKQGAPKPAPVPVDTLDKFVRHSTPAGGSRPGTANGGSIFAGKGRPSSGARPKAPIARDAVFPLDVSDEPMDSGHAPVSRMGAPPTPQQYAAAPAAPPSVFGSKGGRGVDKLSVFPDGPPPPSSGPLSAGRPRGDPTAAHYASAQSAAAEFAALGLGGVKPPPSSGGGMPQYGMKQPSYGQPALASSFGQPAFGMMKQPQQPAYVQAMQALPAAGSRSNRPEPFRLG